MKFVKHLNTGMNAAVTNDETMTHHATALLVAAVIVWEKHRRSLPSFPSQIQPGASAFVCRARATGLACEPMSRDDGERSFDRAEEISECVISERFLAMNEQ
jgi:hypothetical protein